MGCCFVNKKEVVYRNQKLKAIADDYNKLIKEQEVIDAKANKQPDIIDSLIKKVYRREGKRRSTKTKPPSLKLRGTDVLKRHKLKFLEKLEEKEEKRKASL